MDAVAANAPVFFLHPRESFFPCTVEWFLQRSQLCVMRSVMLSRRVQRGTAQGRQHFRWWQLPHHLRMRDPESEHVKSAGHHGANAG